jgi:8-oxo-dGTP pyrophosphatase MutT (NUDIX family)
MVGSSLAYRGEQPFNRDPSMNEPDYACAVLRNAAGDFVLQLRPASARLAANQLTCFGGRCEAGETAAACLIRELHEELGWNINSLPPPCAFLRTGPRLIASFYTLFLPAALVVRTEPGFSVIYAPPASLPGLPLSPWHRLVLEALLTSSELPITLEVPG